MDITPDKQNIDRLFSNTTYYIDFYQRDYKWTQEPVQRLIDDIFYVFDSAYARYQTLDPTTENITKNYPWYYLNSYVTNRIDGRVYVVDGQQRLTTITLILVKLYHLTKALESNLNRWVGQKICGHSGYENQYWMNHERHINCLEDLYKGEAEPNTDTGVTAENMVSNYQLISNILSRKLDSKHKLDSFIFFFLNRLVLIDLSVEQTDVPMVFEVINDRGVRLRPYEILKGKLLGQIDKGELENGGYARKWDECAQRVNDFKSDEFDVFFTYYLKARFADTRGTGKNFDNDYHREMFKKSMNNRLNLEHNPKRVKEFISKDLNYYTKLYARLWKATESVNSEFPHAYFNRLNDMDSQFHLLLSACKVDDSEEDEKIAIVTHGLDRLFTLLQLQQSYNSNHFVETIYSLSKSIREKPAQEVKQEFNSHLLSELSWAWDSEINKPFTYGRFKETSIQNVLKRFTRYFFARIEQYISKNANIGLPAEFGDMVTKTGSKTGYHIEHILSNNDQNLGLYENDQEAFDIDRNRLGAVLLLKGKDNQSSGKENFKKKLKTYSGTLLWSQSLHEDFYKSNLDFTRFVKEEGLGFSSCSQFGPEQVERRHKLLYHIVENLWVKPN